MVAYKVEGILKSSCAKVPLLYITDDYKNKFKYYLNISGCVIFPHELTKVIIDDDRKIIKI